MLIQTMKTMRLRLNMAETINNLLNGKSIRGNGGCERRKWIILFEFGRKKQMKQQFCGNLYFAFILMELNGLSSLSSKMNSRIVHKHTRIFNMLLGTLYFGV